MPEGQFKDICRSQFNNLKALEFVDDGTFEETLEVESEKSYQKHKENVRKENEKIEKRNVWRAARGWKPAEYKVETETKESLKKRTVDQIKSFKTDPYVKAHLKSQHFGEGTNRVFTNLTTLKSEFRRFFKAGGEDTINLDIRASQVTLMASLYDADEESTKEKAKFAQFLTEHDFYNKLIEETKSDLTRQEGKVAFYEYMFSKLPQMVKTRFYKSFAEAFPILNKTITALKKNNYRYLAHKLQSIESDLIVRSVFGRLAKEGVWALTIHDSVVCKASQAEYIKGIISDTFLDYIGFRPVIK